jgi:23S rRNA pseudouridine1911/1915/1917 synthase
LPARPSPSSRGDSEGRLDVLLIAAYPELSRRKAREVIEKGQVEVDGVQAREPGLRVEASSAIVWDPNRKALPRARLSLPRLYEDETVLVVDKPAGLLTVASAPGKEGEDTVRDRVLHYVTKLHPRRPYVGVVHRLDRDTSGALAVALAPAAREGLRELFRRHAIHRRYLAIVRLTEPLASDEGVIDLPLHTEYRGGRRRVARPGEPSVEAVTRYRVRERFRDTAVVELELETGRQHQIRIHLAGVGMPVIGDPVYGSGSERAGSLRARVRRQMLHAWLLELTHPLTGVKVRAESPLPEDFSKVLAELRGRRSTHP